MAYDFYKKNPTDKVYWVDHVGVIGELLVSFDGTNIFNLFLDYPWNFSAEQKQMFDKENPFWADFFKGRQ